MKEPKKPTIPPADVIHRGTIVHTIEDPFRVPEDEAFRGHEDGGLLVDSAGRILACDDFETLRAQNRGATMEDWRGCFILPALVDCHIHYPQTTIHAAYGEQLLDWLEVYIFPEEARFSDLDYAQQRARLFFDELIAQGTGTALIFGAHFEEATATAFKEAARRGFRAVMGMTLGDRNLPESLCMKPERAYEACSRLIESYHENGELLYAVTPRFVPSCSGPMLEMCRRLLEEHKTVRLQSHINENRQEIQWVKDLHPRAPHYFGVYESYGLVGDRTILAHSVHVSEPELEQMGITDTAVAHCPNSNQFLGSGLFSMGRHLDHGIRVGLGTDVGGGPSFSMLREMEAAYKVQSLLLYGLEQPENAVSLGGVRLLYLATLAGARALGLEDRCGSFLPGRAADFIVIDPSQDPIVQARIENSRHILESLFVLAISADKRLIREVRLAGRPARAPARDVVFGMK